MSFMRRKLYKLGKEKEDQHVIEKFLSKVLKRKKPANTEVKKTETVVRRRKPSILSRPNPQGTTTSDIISTQKPVVGMESSIKIQRRNPKTQN